eukprot:TRINITY_DN9637_c0_g1_i1.p1 TRINITY_DN9637_c0_g1~~TRINITY_DN9637_c0_g1_i1.p1  ORF type:complete len:836 (-),score=143.68 TRINITY_DN9637_c0_g1_i1:1086-3593(-)
MTDYQFIKTQSTPTIPTAPPTAKQRNNTVYRDLFDLPHMAPRPLSPELGATFTLKNNRIIASVNTATKQLSVPSFASLHLCSPNESRLPKQVSQSGLRFDPESQLFTGVATKVWPDGSRYIGDWFQGKRQGTGSQSYANGSSYEGEWKDDMRQGWGVLRHSFLRYEGTWLNDSRDGYGISLQDSKVILQIWIKGSLIASRLLSFPKPDTAIVHSLWKDLCEGDLKNLKSIIQQELENTCWLDLFTTSSLEDNALELTDELIHISRKEHSQKDKKISIISMDTKPFQSFFAKCMKNSVCWPSLFYSRMVRKKELLPQSEFKRCSAAMSAFINQTKKATGTSSSVFSAALDLHVFFNTHEYDIDGSIIGLAPSEEVITSMSKVGVSLAGTIQQNVTKDGKKLRKGDIVIAEVRVREDEKKFIFARCSGKAPKQDEIEVYLSADERSTAVIDLEKVYRLSSDLLSLMNYGSIRSMERLVNPPVKELITQMLQEIKLGVYKFLEDCQLSVELLKKASSNQLTIADLIAINHTKTIFDDILGLMSPSMHYRREFLAFVSNLETKLNDRRATFLKQCSVATSEFTILPPTFVPSQVQLQQELISFPISEHITNRVNFQSKAVGVALEDLALKRREFISGQKKKSLAEWWLKLIKEEVNSFLFQCGFVLEAVPDNYTDVPPPSMQDVKNNSKILSAVIDPSHDVYNVKELLYRMKATVYPVVDDFIQKSLTIIADAIEQTNREKGILCPLNAYDHMIYGTDRIAEATARVREAFSETNPAHKWVFEMLKDITYLVEMKSREDKDVGNALDVVPVSGLVVGRFVRLQNELKTVIEIWDRPETG